MDLKQSLPLTHSVNGETPMNQFIHIGVALTAMLTLCILFPAILVLEDLYGSFRSSSTGVSSIDPNIFLKTFRVASP